MPTISKKIFFWVLLITLQVLVLYIFLVVADFGLQRYLSYSEETKVSEAESIERKRVAEEDRPQRRMAISQGFKPLFYPETVDIYSPLRNLALRQALHP